MLRPLPVALLLVALASGAGAQEAVLDLGDAFTGSIDSVFDADTVQFAGVAGTLLTATAAGKQGFHPTLSLVDVSTGLPVDVADFLFGAGKPKVSLKKLPLPSTGDYLLTVGAADESVGEYKLTTKGKIGKTLKSFKADGSSGEPGGGVLTFAAMPGTTLTATVKAAKGFTSTPGVPLLDGPDGPLDLTSATDLIEGKVPKAKVTGFPLLAMGDYTFTPVEVGAEGKVPPLTTTLKLTFPKVQKTTIAEQPTFANTNTQLVSVNSDGQQGFANSLEASIAYDGHAICFKSHATNLVPGSGGLTQADNCDIFVRDENAQTTVVASAPSDSDDGTGGCESPTLDGSGTVAAFASISADLVAGDDNGSRDIFVRDVPTRQTTRVSVANGGVQAHGHSIDPDLSQDGQKVVFASLAADLVTGDGNALQDIFLHDRGSNTTIRVSVSASGGEADGASSDPVISGDGLRVAFTSTASNLLPPGSDTNGKADVYVKDLTTGEVLRASLSASGTQVTNVDSNQPSISSNGRFVAFVSSGFFAPTAINGSTDVFVKDLLTGTVDHVSLDANGEEGNGHSVLPQLSGSGQLVLFRSNATNLMPSDGNGSIGDVLLRDRPSKVTVRVNVSNFGEQGNNECVSGDLSGDGSTAAFYGLATNLNPDSDINGPAFDVWIRY